VLAGDEAWCGGIDEVGIGNANAGERGEGDLAYEQYKRKTVDGGILDAYTGSSLPTG
jgi:hypothetical protein